MGLLVEGDGCAKVRSKSAMLSVIVRRLYV